MARLLAGEVGGGGSGDEGVEGGISDAAAVAEAASRLARRHLGVAEQLAAEKKASKAATEAPKAAAAEAAAGEGAPDGGGAAPLPPPSAPLLSLSAAVRSLVAATLAHPRSKELYGSFPVTSKGWRRLPRVYGSASAGAGGEGKGSDVGVGAGTGAGAAASSPPASSSSSPPPPPLPPALVAIDCEMVETEGGDQTDLARVAVAASIPLCWFEEDEEEGGGGEGGEDGKKQKDDGGGAEEEDKAAHGGGGDGAPSPPSPPLPPKQLSPLEAAAISLRKAGYGPPHLVLSSAVAPARRVSDWRPGITGLTRCSLAAAPMSRAGAQRAVVAAVARASGWRLGAEGGAEGEEEEGSPPPSPSPPPAPGPAARPRPRRLPAPAVLVGHALHHDLRALRLCAASGELVIDTALLYGYEGLPRATPGLADLYAAVVGRKSGGGGKGGGSPDEGNTAAAAAVAPLRSPGAPHDCAADAVAALALAAEALAARVGSGSASGARRPTGRRITVPAPARKVDRDELCKLLVHGLRPPAPPSDFDAAAAVAGLFDTMPAGVARPRFVEAVAAAPGTEKEATGAAATTTKPAAAAATKAWAVFATPAEADAAFAALPLPNPGSPSSASVATDSLGRPQRLARIPATAVAPAAAGNGGETKDTESPESFVPSALSSQVVRVRKAAAHAGMSHGRFKPAKRDRSAASVRHGREQKMRRK